jgi:hypothetical protein
MTNYARPGCIVHAGMYKTGTTSIQSSLFYGLQSDRFRLLSLDAFCGNWLIGSAFADDYGVNERFISNGVTPRMAATVPRRSRDYLDRALAAAGRRGATPILSAEIIGSLSQAAVERLRDFLVGRGWQPRVIIYARAPLDQLGSMFQQRVRAGDIASRMPASLPEFIDYSARHGYATPLRMMDEVFGRENVSMQWFDPASFPGGCVVRHFCGVAGIPFRESAVMRVNEAASLDATRFLYALVVAGHRRKPDLLRRLGREIRLERLGELRGPPPCLHPGVTAPYADAIRRELGWVESRLGRAVPLSLHARDTDAGLRCEADLLDFSVESLDWLAKTTGRRVVKPGQGADTVRGVVEQVEAIGGLGSASTVRRVVAAGVRERWRRTSLWYENLWL